jgi:GT2 family glycosyltransferase
MTVEMDVIVPTRDRPTQLAACLAALARQTFKGFRVVVVDDGSRTPLRMSEGPSLLVLRNDSPAGPAASRNRGIAAANAPLVVFLDDDTLAHPDLIDRHRDVFARDPGPVVSIGALLPPDVRLPPWDLWQADRLQREHERLRRGEVTPSWTHLYTGNVAARREDLEAVGGFDVSFARQEDVDLGYRLHRHGCRFVFDHRAVVSHDAVHSLADWLRIPAASARFDVHMDRVRPDSDRLRMIRAELGARHWLLRAARRAFRRPAAGRLAERLAVTAGRVLHRARADPLAMLAFSLVWDLEYCRSLAQEVAGLRQPARP